MLIDFPFHSTNNAAVKCGIMDPLTILGIACNVMQVIGFAHETISICKKIYDNGSADESLASTAAQMRVATKGLHDSIQKPPEQLTEDDKELITIANSCSETAEKLSKEADTIIDKQSADKGKVARLKTTFSLVLKRNWKTNKIAALERDLERWRSVLNNGLLIRLYNQNGMSNVFQQMNLDATKAVNLTLHSLVTEHSKAQEILAGLLRIAQTHASQEQSETRQIIHEEHDTTRKDAAKEHKEMRAHTTQEHNSTQGIVKAEHQQTRTEIKSEAHGRQLEAERTQIMDSLDYGGRNERQNDITEAHSQTFTWLFGESRSTGTDIAQSEQNIDRDHREIYKQKEGEDWVLEDLIAETKQNTWDSFSDWLKSDKKLFWISGKAGAGKSTLMKFLYSSPETQCLLHEKGCGDTLLLGHSLYLMGTSPMQNNMKGLFCNLIYQLFQQDSERLLTCQQLQIQAKKSVSDWSEKELYNVLTESLSLVSGDRRICIFLDGLDEIHPSDGPYKLLNFLAKLLQEGPQDMKLCVSSRPEKAFKDSLGVNPHLELHHLTAPDMYRYAQDLLGSWKQFPEDATSWERQEFSHSRKKTFWPTANQKYASKIVGKSDGVFLWARLAVKSLERALTNNDTYTIIEKRLEDMPSDLAKLYASMWARLNPDDQKIYRAEAALYLNLAICWHEYTFPTNYFSSMEVYDDSYIFTLGHVTLALKTMELSRTRKPIAELSGFDSIPSDCDAIYSKIPIRCADLLEVSKNTYENRLSLSSKLPDMQVNFIHRTAREFLTETPGGQDILKYDTSLKEERLCALLHAYILRSWVFLPPELGDDGIALALESKVRAGDISFVLSSVQKEISKATWLKWIEIWVKLLDQIPQECFWLDVKSDMLGSAASDGLEEFVTTSFHRSSASYTADYKNYILQCAAEWLPSGIESCFKWFKMLDFLFLQGCMSQMKLSFTSSFTLVNASAFELFLWGASEILDYENLMSNTSLCDRFVQTFRHFLDHGADIDEVFYCIFWKGAFRRDDGQALLQNDSKETHTLKGIKTNTKALVKWTLHGALNHFAPTLQNTYFGRKLAEVLVSQGTMRLEPPKILVIGRDTTSLGTNWSKAAKKVSPATEERILEVIMTSIPWDIENYDQKRQQLALETDNIVTEILNDGEGTKDLTDYMMHELNLGEICPRALDWWLRDNLLDFHLPEVVPVKFKKDLEHSATTITRT